MRPADPLAVTQAARSWIGTPYHDQASVKGVGCDCLGLARGVWREVIGREPMKPPPYSRDWGEIDRRETFAEAIRPFMIEIDPAEAGLGALILFRMRDRAPAKHCGILIAQGAALIHAYERCGVIVEPYDCAWKRRAAFAFLFPASEP
jgi:NlpC/P60 family putative phage cell wall peptidase